jgi:hypothetical protein
MTNDESSIDHNAQAPQMRGLAFDQRPGIEPDPFSCTPAKRSARKRGPAPKIQQQLEQIGRLPVAKQRAIAQMLDAMLQQHGS